MLEPIQSIASLASLTLRQRDRETERDFGCVLLKCLIVVFAAIRGNEGTMVIAVLNKLRGYEVHSLM